MRAVQLSANLVPALHDFVADVWRIDGVRSEMHVGDMYVALYFECSGELEDSARLWFDAQLNIVGAAFFAGSTVDMVIRSEAAAAVAHNMIAWAISEARRRDPHARTVRVQRRPRLLERVDFLENLGFRRMDQGAFVFTRGLDELPSPDALPLGLECRQLVSGDVASRMRGFTDAFPNQPHSVGAFERLRQSNGYDAFLDLVVVDGSGEVAGFCTAWLDRVNGVGLFEPLGVCSAYRRLGLARAVMLEGCKRLKLLGAKSAVVRARSTNIGAIACYRSLGFTMVCDIFGFERPIVE